MNKTGTVALTAIGCRTNQEEVTSLSAALREDGYHIVQHNTIADIIIINTCSVTAGTESKTKRLIKSVTRKYPGARVLVTGCMAQQIPEELLEIPGVTWVVGNTRKKDIPQIIKNEKDGLFYSPINDKTVPAAAAPVHPTEPPEEWRTRYPVKIQEGCDYRCSYCIVPLLRGPSRSVGRNDILTLCRRVADVGYKEIVFTGTHIGQYEDNNGYRLVQLIDEVLALPGDFRIRLSSLDPRDCTDELLTRITEESRLCDHIHVSVQSLCPEVLAGMNRVYTEYDTFIERILSFRSRSPYAGIGGDFIVGFPGETKSMFETTLAMAEKIGFNYGHVFRYSKRPGTVAATMQNHISEKDKIERSSTFRSLLDSQRTRFIQKQLHSVIHTIIIEREKPIHGITSNYIRVEVPALRRNRNTWLPVRITSYSADRNYCIGALCEEQ